ncbi:MAG: carbon monoxide dehydrogenase subunit G [Alphaproteobacteria bacterium]|nr:carbon monoxide dehydrogenase subunit G [Alphaproteobacteria bacterium]
MELTGRYVIPAAPGEVWDALNDAATLQDCIPGCEAVEKTSPTEFLATATLTIGPMKASFKGVVSLTDLDPPRRCVVRGEGHGGAAGFAKGSAEVVLTPDGDGTILTYTAKASVGGKLAQVGQRLIDGAVRQIADDFFGRFAAALTRRKTGAAGPKGDAQQDAGNMVVTEPSPREGLPPRIWVAGLIAIVAILLFVFGVLT